MDGWNLANEGGTLKLKRSWKVKSFTKGLDMFQLISDIAETEGTLCYVFYSIQVSNERK